jgi:hypothetical protein
VFFSFCALLVVFSNSAEQHNKEHIAAKMDSKQARLLTKQNNNPCSTTINTKIIPVALVNKHNFVKWAYIITQNILLNNGITLALKKAGPKNTSRFKHNWNKIGARVPHRTNKHRIQKHALCNKTVLAITCDTLLCIVFVWSSLEYHLANEMVEINRITAKRHNKHRPRVGSVAKLCTEANKPERTTKVPQILKLKVVRPNIIVQHLSDGNNTE